MWKIEEEVKIRKVVKTDEHKYFFDWDTPQENKLKGESRPLTSECFIVVDELKLGIDYDRSNSIVQIWTEQKSYMKICKKGEIFKKLIIY
jgi:hypothetical protein